MILAYDKFWAHYLEDIDIKSDEWPWTSDFWVSETKRNLIKMWLEKDDAASQKIAKTPRGFIAYRFVSIRDLVDMGEDIAGVIIHIEKLAVHPDWRGKGIGGKLLESVETAAKLQNVNILAVILHEENDTGRNWLMGRGFIACKLHRKFFPDGRDGYSFTKMLQ